jgi:hypothetical protein
MTLPTPPAPGDDVAASILTLGILLAIFTVTWWCDREHKRITERHEREDQRAFDQTIGEKPRPKLLTEADIVERALRRRKGGRQ